MNYKKIILVTGGSGFIGSHLVELFVKNYPDYLIINYDMLTYAGNEENNESVRSYNNYKFIQGDICNYGLVYSTMLEFGVTDIIHLAAESHVDRSIENPMDFLETNVRGTLTLLNVAKSVWGEKSKRDEHLFYHVSTDEVYGSLGLDGFFTEKTSYDPRSPYSASKASSDHFVRAYYHTYGLPIVISNCSNNFGPKQYPEKLIPVIINNLKNKKPIPVYGKGDNIRDWLWVKDHASAIDVIFHKSEVGKTYNIGGNNEWKNINIVTLICDIYDEIVGNELGSSRELIKYVEDRKGHDYRYAIDSSKLEYDLGWKPSKDFNGNIAETVMFYLKNN